MRHFLTILGLLFFRLAVAQIDNLNIIHARAHIRIEPAEKKVSGEVEYKLKLRRAGDSLVFDAAPEVKILSVRAGKKKLEFRHKGNRLVIPYKYKAGKKWDVSIRFVSHPKQAMYFTGWNTPYRKQVWTQGQGKNNSHWMPGIDDRKEKFTWEISIDFPAGYTVVSNGKLLAADTIQSDVWNWKYRLEHPAPFYLLFVGAGKYGKIERDKDIPLTDYYYADEKPGLVSYRLSDTLFRWMQAQMGVPYPWSRYRKIPLKNFFYGGMENVTATVFADDYYVNDSALAGSRTLNVLAHELAHQWVGDYVTAVSTEHHWIHESMASFFANEAEAHFYGQSYALRKKAEDLAEIFRAYENGDTLPLLQAGASSVSLYVKGARVLEILKNRLGDKVFRKVIKHFLENHPYATVTTSDFKKSLYAVTGDSLEGFFSYWFGSSRLPVYSFTKENNKLKVTVKNPWPMHVRLYLKGRKYKNIRVNGDTIISLPEDYVFYLPNPSLEIPAKTEWGLREEELLHAIRYRLSSVDFKRIIRRFEEIPFVRKKAIFKDISRWPYDYTVYAEIIRQFPGKWGKEEAEMFQNMLMQSGDEGKAVLLSMLPRQFPGILVPVIEKMLDAPSYAVVKTALSKLIVRAPENAGKYLQKTAGKGMMERSKDLRIFWLINALSSDTYTVSQKKAFFKEWISYTNPGQDVSARITAFEWLTLLEVSTPETFRNAMEASGHFHPRLRKTAKKYLEKIRSSN